MIGYCCLFIALMILNQVNGRSVQESLQVTENLSLINSDNGAMFNPFHGESLNADEDLEIAESRLRKRRRNHNLFAKVRWNWSIVPELVETEPSLL